MRKCLLLRRHKNATFFSALPMKIGAPSGAPPSLWRSALPLALRPSSSVVARARRVQRVRVDLAEVRLAGLDARGKVGLSGSGRRVRPTSSISPIAAARKASSGAHKPTDHVRQQRRH
jgi:hypothetical protein